MKLVGLFCLLSCLAISRPSLADTVNGASPPAGAVSDARAGAGQGAAPDAAPVSAPTTATTPLPAAAPVPNPALDFDLFADDKGAASSSGDVEKVTAAANLRRKRLHTHQTLGLVTWGLMAVTAVVGQLNYDDVYGSGGGRTGHYLWPHRLLGYATAGTFATAAGYALFAPTPYKQPLKLDSSLVHRIAVVGAALGMVAQVALGFYTARKADAGNPDGLATDAKTHLVIGYATLGMLTIAGAAWVF